MYQRYREEITKLDLFGEVGINQIVFGYLNYDLFDLADKYLGINFEPKEEQLVKDLRACNFMDRVIKLRDNHILTQEFNFYDKETLTNAFRSSIETMIEMVNKAPVTKEYVNSVGQAMTYQQYKELALVVRKNGSSTNMGSLSHGILVCYDHEIISHNDLVKLSQIYQIDKS